jgi:aromatic ring hydroxylase
MPATMTGSPKGSPVGGTQQTHANKASFKTNKYLQGLPESEAKQRARMLSKVSETTGGKSRRTKTLLDAFGRPTGEG